MASVMWFGLGVLVGVIGLIVISVVMVGDDEIDEWFDDRDEYYENKDRYDDCHCDHEFDRKCD